MSRHLREIAAARDTVDADYGRDCALRKLRDVLVNVRRGAGPITADQADELAAWCALALGERIDPRLHEHPGHWGHMVLGAGRTLQPPPGAAPPPGQAGSGR